MCVIPECRHTYELGIMGEKEFEGEKLRVTENYWPTQILCWAKQDDKKRLAYT